jgi:Dyp-type peroxidase family
MDMAVTVNAPLAWKTATGDDATMLDALQPNILKGHVRDSLTVLFLHFGDTPDATSFLSALVPFMKSAKTHLQEAEAFATNQIPGTAYLGVGLTRSGYAALGVAQVPGDSSFQRGMKHPASRATLSDPPSSLWEAPYREDIHAVILIGDATDTATSPLREQVLSLVPDSATVLGEETGIGRHNANGDGIEHFGYVDGRSQPLFLAEDIQAAAASSDGITVWDPSTALDRVLVSDPAAPDPTLHFGSYFVFRKLEQNVRRFKQAEEAVAEALGLLDDDLERAGAMLVGRFEDGTPVTMQSAEGAHHPVMNNFTYASDGDGLKCPFHAHIRKTNPRGSGQFQSPEDEKLHLMARRGQTYGERSDDPNDPDVTPEQRPSGGVGLLFMAFNANISLEDDFGLSQFDFTQSVWANNAGFPGVPPAATPPGLDPVIGQGVRVAPGSEQQAYPDQWGGTTTTLVDPIAQAVHMVGGEYFFMPSLAFLRSL